MIERFLSSSLHRAASTTSRLEDDARLSRDLHVPASPPPHRYCYLRAETRETARYYASRNRCSLQFRC